MSKQLQDLKAQQNKEDKRFFLLLVASLVVTVVFLFVAPGEKGILGVFGLWMLSGGFLMLLISGSSNLGYEIRSVTEHIHRLGCTKEGLIEVQRDTRTEIDSSVRTWAGASVYEVITHEVTICSECGSVTHWVPGKPRYLEE